MPDHGPLIREWLDGDEWWAEYADGWIERVTSFNDARRT